MSSSVFVIGAGEQIPKDLTPIDLILWSITNVSKDFLGKASFFNKNPVFYISRSAAYNVSHKWGDYIQHLNDVYDEEEFEVDKQKLKELFTKTTIAIYHERIGYLDKEQWFEFVDQNFFIMGA